MDIEVEISKKVEHLLRDSTEQSENDGLKTETNEYESHNSRGSKMNRGYLEVKFSSVQQTNEPKKPSQVTNLVTSEFDDPKNSVFGFERLVGYLTLEAGHVVRSIHGDLKEWTFLLKNVESEELIVLILYVIGEKVCQDKVQLTSERKLILMESLSRHFVDQLSRNICSLSFSPISSLSSPESPGNPNEIFNPTDIRTLSAAYAFVSCVSHCLPGKTHQLSSLLTSSIGTAGFLKESNAKFDEVHNKLMSLTINIELAKIKGNFKHGERSRFVIDEAKEARHEQPPPDDFRSIEIVPSLEELLFIEEPFLRTNKIYGAYKSGYHYRDVHFRLLRQDLVASLKAGIQDFLKFPKEYLSGMKKMSNADIRLYPKTKIVDFQLVRNEIVFDAQLESTVASSYNWSICKRLRYGSLLVFTPDLFKTAYFAVIAVRNETNLTTKGMFGITWEKKPPCFGLDQTFLMIECPGYFEAYRHHLHILQELWDFELFPMYRFVVQASNVVRLPKYMRKDYPFKPPDSISIEIHGSVKTVNPMNEEEWPTATQLGLNDSQRKAFMTALTSEIAIIQGPPGTGKTFLGLKIAESLLRNRALWKTTCSGKRSPLLVVCQTNHALDQFLEGIVNIFETKLNMLDPPILRVGSRSSSEILEPFTLFNRKDRMINEKLFPKDHSKERYKALFDVKNLQKDRAQLIYELRELLNINDIVDLLSLKISEELKKDVNESLLNHLRTDAVKWFQPEQLELQYQSIEDCLASIFDMTTPTRNIEEVVDVKVVPRYNDADSEDEEEDFYEDRIVDEVVAGDIGGRKKKKVVFEPQPLKRAAEGSVCKINLNVEECKQKLNSEESNPDSRAQNEHRLAFRRKKRAFLNSVFQSKKDGLLNLPSCKKEWLAPKPYVSGCQWLVDLKLSERWAIYFAVVEKAVYLTNQRIEMLVKEINDAQIHLKMKEQEGEALVLANSETLVVGMTTTGAGKYHHLLETMQNKIEEAAEVLEGHIVSCLTRYCEQLILIGDHQQLRPSTGDYNLARNYHLDVSLFERMFNNNLSCYQLEVQHRMRPEIADLVVGTIYETLQNAPSVEKYPKIKGMSSNLYFLTHNQFEHNIEHTASKANVYEAELIVGLCRYLILQGYSPNKITVLTMYTGQKTVLREKFRGFEICAGVRTEVVDNFQGEENDIILLSLVRNNFRNEIGFLKADNRICVALSRAKHGLFICGNMNLLAKASTTWRLIRVKLDVRGLIGPFFTLKCQKHGILTEVSSGEDFATKAPTGGCHLPCKALLKCTHFCERNCHMDDEDHDMYLCQQPSTKECPNHHPYVGVCHAPCPPCKTLVLKTLLPCRHQKMLFCHLDESQVRCCELVEKQLSCKPGHSATLACWMSPEEYQCLTLVDKRLPCGHMKNIQCSQDPRLITCKAPTSLKLTCGHSQMIECRFKNSTKCSVQSCGEGDM